MDNSNFVNVSNYFPLSGNQQALWALHHLYPGNPASNVFFSARVSALDFPRLIRILQSTVDRHEILRCRFQQSADGPRHKVLDRRQPVDLRVVDIESGSPSLEDLLTEIVQLPFRLEEESAFRFVLLRRQDKNPVLCIVAHHLICDLWSLVLLLEEIGERYSRPFDHTLSHLTHAGGSKGGSYRDYVCREERLRNSKDGKEAFEYWQRQLAEVNPSVGMPTDYPYPEQASFAGATVAFEVNCETTAKLKSLARERGTTFNTLLLAFYCAFLHLQTAQPDLIVGVPANTRYGPFRRTIGYFVNVLPIRSKASRITPTVSHRLWRCDSTRLCRSVVHSECEICS